VDFVPLSFTLSFTLYQFSLGLHAVFAISFLGVAGANGVIGPMGRENPQHALFALKVTHKIHNTVVLPGIVGIIATGVYLTIKGDWSMSDAWLLVSLALVVLLVIFSIFILHPATGVAIKELEDQEEPGPPSEQFQKAVAKLGAFGPMMGLMMIVVAFLMSAKPF
jgi:uncharacterized membrane protein